MKLTGKSDSQEPTVTEEEIHAVIDEGSESGVIEAQERDMARNLFRLDDRTIATLMTPRSEVEWIDLQDDADLNVRKIVTSQHSRLPIADGSLDDIKGFCSTRVLLRQLLENGKVDFTSQMAKAAYVPETLTGLELLENFRDNDIPVAIVVDEYGTVQGLVSPRDVLEAIAGEFKPGLGDDSWIVEREDGSLLLDGMLAVPELKDRLQLKSLPQESEGRYNTLAGMIIWIMEHIPTTGEVVMWEGWRFEVVDMDGRRVDKVLVSRVPEETKHAVEA